MAERPLDELKRLVATQPPPRDFVGALSRGQRACRLRGASSAPEWSSAEPGTDIPIRLIAEVKRASPSRGVLSPSLDAGALAQCYARSGAAAISVLTEPSFFRGSLADLTEVRAAVELPLLRKDFVLDPYQVYEARAAGTDAVLLICGILSLEQLAHLLDATRSLGMAALVEVHDGEELERALSLQPRVVGINNRNLADFTVDLGTTLRLLPGMPESTVVVSESGIHSRADVVRLRDAGVDAILVGEALVTCADPEEIVRELIRW